MNRFIDDGTMLTISCSKAVINKVLSIRLLRWPWRCTCKVRVVAVLEVVWAVSWAWHLNLCRFWSTFYWSILTQTTILYLKKTYTVLGYLWRLLCWYDIQQDSCWDGKQLDVLVLCSTHVINKQKVQSNRCIQESIYHSLWEMTR